MTGRFEGKIALVTGGARNVGKAISLRLAAEGAFVIVNHWRSPAQARETLAEIQARGGRGAVIRASVAVAAQRNRMFDQVAQEYGGLDILVNNAADGALVGVGEVTDAMIDKAVDTNLKGGFGCARRAAELMAGRDGANIVNLSTVGGGQLVMANYFACGPAKAAVEAMTRYLAVEYAPQGIRVNAAAAGMLKTPVADQFPDSGAMQRAVVDATPMGRLGTPEELAALVAFLASTDASWITGQVVLADGGMSTGAALLAPRLSRTRIAAGAVDDDAGPDDVGSDDDEAFDDAAVSDDSAFDDGVVSDDSGSDDGAVPDDRELSVGGAVSDDHKVFEDAAVPNDHAALDDDAVSDQDAASDAIAIVGMGIVVPGASNPEQYWDELISGADLFEPAPPQRWHSDSFYSADGAGEDKSYSRHGAFIRDFQPHHVLAEELRDGKEMEATTLWLRHSVLQAMDSVRRRRGDRVSFQAGYTADGNQHLEEATVVSGVLRRLRTALAQRGVPDADRLAARAEKRLRTRYPRSVGETSRFFPHRVGRNAITGVLPADTDVVMVDTACSSSLYAVDIGAKGLLENRYDIAVCAGAFAVGPRGSVLFGKLNGLSRTGEVRALDRTADGVLFSDGAATVVLKRLSRARADGDRVLGTITAFGSSSDGKGKAIYAPSAAGQELAIRRALSGTDRTPDWIIAHATGTPAGDVTEFGTLRSSFDSVRPIRVTSNKSVIGHTGWAAGTASLIQVLLGFQHETITPQHRYTSPPDEFALDSGDLAIPTSPVSWVASDAPRVASVSGFGFGGTNAHLVVTEPVAAAGDPGKPVAAEPTAVSTVSSLRAKGGGAQQSRLAVVAVATHLPDAMSLDGWLADPAARVGFGDRYPLPPLTQVKMPPPTMRAIDRCQLMVLACARSIRDELGDFWTRRQGDTGVVLGHFGGTRNATLYALRCYLDDVAAALRGDADLAGEDERGPWIDEVLADIAADIKALVPPSTEDTFPGMMPNVIPARVANYFGLNGLNMTVDTGFTSAVTAIDIAGRYLRTGELSMALVGGINGNSTPEQRELLATMLPEQVELAEGAFLLALTTPETARAEGLPILGYLDTNPAPNDMNSVIECGATPSTHRATFLAAEGAVGILRALGTVGRDGRALVVCRGGADAPDFIIGVEGAGARAEEPAIGGPGQSAGFADDSANPVAAPSIDVHTWQLVVDPGTVVRPPTPFWPDAPTFLLTDDATILDELTLPDTVTVLALSRHPRAVHIADVTPETVAALLDRLDPEARLRHLRLVTALGAEVTSEQTARVQALHDLLFLVTRQRARALATPESSTIAVLMDAITGTTPNPYVGVFTGFVKVAHLEREQGLTFAVVTDGAAKSAVAEAESESMRARGLPVAYYAAGIRHTGRLVADAEPAGWPGALPVDGRIGWRTVESDGTDGGAQLDRDSVIVAVGGARGITAELMVAVAERFGGRFYLLGSSDIEGAPAAYLSLTDEQFATAKRDFIRTRLAADPTRTPGALNAEYQNIANVRRARSTLERIAVAGAEVTYLECDVTDLASVRQAVDRILGASGRIDLLVNAAGRNRSSRIAVKDFAEFRAIRDIKLVGYTNLRVALAAHPPRLWCNFGSLVGITGQVGEVDYTCGNDFLATAASSRAVREPGRETTIGWTRWAEVGLAADGLAKDYYDKSGRYSKFTNTEGVQRFMEHIERPRPQVAHLGVAEYGTIDALLPGFLGPTPRPFYRDRLIASGVTEGRPWAVHERTFDLTTDPYLADHQVHRSPTLPATFVAEMAVEAAAALLPGLRVHALEDLELHHFLKLGNRPQVKRIRAEVIRQDSVRTSVAVTVTGDVVAPNGTVLITDRPHFTVTALLSPVLPPAPRWPDWYPADEVPVIDAYHDAASPISLRGPFVSTTDTRLHPLGKRATARLRVAPDDPLFSRFRVPTLLLDGLLRTGALAEPDADGAIPIVAPRRIGRLDLYEHTNDALLAPEPIELYAVVPAAGDNRFAAVRRDGRVVVSFTDVDWAPIGFLTPATQQTNSITSSSESR